MFDHRKNYGQDFNFYQKLNVSNTDFGNPVDGYKPDILIPFTTQSVILLNEDDADVVEYSFNGITVHGELDPTLPSKCLVFDNRVICQIWFRVKSGSSGPITVRVDAWAIR